MNRLKSNQIFSFKKFFLAFIFILTAGNPFLMQNIENSILVILMFMIVFFWKDLIIQKKDIKAVLIILYFILFEFIHRFIFDLDNSKTITRVFFYFLTGYLFSKIMFKDFLYYYIKTLYYLAIVSIVFYIIAYSGPFIYQKLYEFSNSLFPLRLDYNNYATPTLLLYTFDPAFVSGETQLLRNPGFTWEAGGFSTFINIAIVFYLLISEPKDFISFLKDKISLVLILSLLLTFSTAGYISLFVIFSLYFMRRFSILNLLLLVLFIIASYLSYNSFDFLGMKIQSQLESASYSKNRFGAALLDLKDFSERPIFGWSRDLEVLFKTSTYDSYSHRPNGLTNFLRSYGLIYFISYLSMIFISVYYYFKRVKPHFSFIGTIIFFSVILIMGFTQQVVHNFFMMSFLFYGLHNFNLKNQY